MQKKQRRRLRQHRSRRHHRHQAPQPVLEQVRGQAQELVQEQDEGVLLVQPQVLVLVLV